MKAVAAGHTVLTPNTELAAALFDAVERAHLEAGREVWPTPRVRDFAGWLREAHAARQLVEADAPRLLGPIDELHLWQEAVDSSSAGQDMLEPAGAARAARRARRVLYEYGIPWGAVAEQASSSEEVRAFLDWNRRFDERCRQLGCISADELLLRPAPSAESIVWIESSEWRPKAREWLLGHGPMLTPSRHASRATFRLKAASPAEELAAIAQWALVNRLSSGHFRAWISIPDLNLRRTQVLDAFDAALAPQRFSLSNHAGAAPYAVAGGTPLAGFASVRAALDLLNASLDVIPFEGFSRLLRAPELQQSFAEAGGAARLDVLLRKHGPSEADLTTWLKLCERVAAAHGIGIVAALQRLHLALHALEDLRGSHAMSRWVGAWITAFEWGPWAMRHRWSSAEYQAAERFRELMAALATADSVFGTQSRRSAQGILRRAARDTAFQEQTGVPPISVSARLIDPWLTYDGLWVAGCSDERWPPPVQPVPLLPIRLQREFGVIAAAPESQLQFALKLQERWAARAAQCVFSHADPGDGRSAAVSPLLGDAVAMASAAPPRPHWLALQQAAPPLECLTDETAPAFSQGERTRGVSTLRAQSRCAFRGFAQTRLGADGLERPVPGFNDRERGELIHHALEHIWSGLRGSDALLSISPDAQAQLLDQGVSGALTKACAVRDPGPVWRAREHERMRSVLAKWLDTERQREPFDVEEIEQGTLEARHAGLVFNVRIDRVDRLRDGSRVLIDYKTGLAAVDWRGERPDNPQLPIYALLRPQALVAVAYGRVNASECSFVAESERRGVFKPRGRMTALEGRPSLAALIDVWSGRIETLAADFAAGRAAVAPTLQACRSCRLHGLCRVPAAFDDEAASLE